MTSWVLCAAGHRREDSTSDLFDVEERAAAFLRELEDAGHVVSYAHINDKDIRPHGPERTPANAA